ncbi:MAG: CDP-diacylglycerol--serine O-phosphatidyltransferase [Candidatus Zixiibacteriota bacterium]
MLKAENQLSGESFEMPNYRPIFPNIFTAGNIFCGFLSLIYAAEGKPMAAAWLIVFAGILDAFDGKVARLSGGATELGKELDSLADFISFGIAPAFLIHTFKLNVFGEGGLIVGFMYITASGYRLARFNLLSSSDEKQNFLGLPVPIAAMGLIGYIIFCHHIWGQIEYAEYLIVMMILFSALMVSQIEYYALPDNFNTRENRIKLLYIIALAIAGLIKPRLLMFPMFLIYILGGLILEGIRIIKNSKNE